MLDKFLLNIVNTSCLRLTNLFLAFIRVFSEILMKCFNVYFEIIAIWQKWVKGKRIPFEIA